MISIYFGQFKGIGPKRNFWLLLAAVTLSARAHAGVLINEILFDAAGADTGKEWVELYNADHSTISVDGWSLEVDGNAFPGTVKARLCGSIGPNGYYLIKEEAGTISSGTIADLVSGTLAMGNAGSKADGIQLLDGDGNVMDRVVYGSTDSDNLCGGICARAPAAANGMSVSRSTPGAAVFVAVSSDAVSPASGGGRCVLPSCPEGTGIFHGLITEVAPAIPGGDYIELFVRAPSDLCGVALYEADVPIKKFAPISLKANTYVLIHASGKGLDETGEPDDRNADGAIDLYSDESSPGITSTANNNLTLKNADGSIADFVSWSVVPEDTYASSKQSAYDLAASSGFWAPRCSANDASCYVAGSVVWFNRASESISRKVGADGYPKRSAPANFTDWQVGAQSPGKGYSHSFEAGGDQLEVFQSPFSPAGEGQYSECIVSYKAPEQSMISLRVYDIGGRQVRSLLDNAISRSNEAQIVAWNGKDDDGRTVEVGIYVIHLEMKRADGASEKELRTAVVGRKLD